MQRASRVALVLVFAALGCSGGSEETERTVAACQRLQDHVIDLRLAEIQQDREAHRRALQQALGRQFVTECMNQTTESYECELKATSIDGLRNCASAD